MSDSKYAAMEGVALRAACRAIILGKAATQFSSSLLSHMEMCWSIISQRWKSALSGCCAALTISSSQQHTAGLQETETETVIDTEVSIVTAVVPEAEVSIVIAVVPEAEVSIVTAVVPEAETAIVIEAALEIDSNRENHGENQ